jgi:hypothetical protein
MITIEADPGVSCGAYHEVVIESAYEVGKWMFRNDY